MEFAPASQALNFVLVCTYLVNLVITLSLNSVLYSESNMIWCILFLFGEKMQAKYDAPTDFSGQQVGAEG